MSPNEDAALLLVTVRRRLRSMAMSLDPAFAQEDWGFLAQQALEKVLKASADLAGVSLTPLLEGLQPFAAKARYSADETPLPGERERILAELEGLTRTMETRLNG